MSTIPAPNYTQTPNAIFDLMPEMKEAELRVTLAIVRATFGWHKEKIRLSVSQLMKLTGLSKQGVANGVTAGIERGTISKESDGDSFCYQLVVNYVDRGANVVGNEGANVVGNEGANVVGTYKESIIKKDIKEKRERIHPDHSRPAQPAMPTQAKPSLSQKPIASQEKLTTQPPMQKRVTSPHLDPRKFKNGYIEHGKGETPAEIYYERFSINDVDTRLAAPLEDDLRKCTDLDRFRAVIVAYSQTTYKRRNIKLILDWYRDGVPAYAQPDSSPASQAAKPALLPLKRWCLNKYNIDNPKIVSQSYDIPEDMIHAQYELYRQQYQQAH